MYAKTFGTHPQRVVGLPVWLACMHLRLLGLMMKYKHPDGKFLIIGGGDPLR